MVIGVPKETKVGENRVSITPDGVAELVHMGLEVIVESKAGSGSSLSDDEYEAAGARLVPTAQEAWAADLVVKVKEPQDSELAYLREGLTIFSYLHLAAYPKVARALLASKTTSIGYETVQLPNGTLPLLTPMSEVAGRLAPQIGAHFLQREQGGLGILIGGTPGTRPAKVTVIGAGNVGWNAAWIAQGMEAEVTILDRNLDRLRFVDQIHKGRIVTMAPNKNAIERAVESSDLLIGAVLVAGERAPVVVTKEMVGAMKDGSVIVDVAVDQGGCIETTVETTHDDPVYLVGGVLHYGVGNIPASVPHTSTFALTNSTLPYVASIASKGLKGASAALAELWGGINTIGGFTTNSHVAATLGEEFAEPTKLVG